MIAFSYYILYKLLPFRVVNELCYHVIVVYHSIISKLMCFSDQKANTIMYYWMSFLLDFGITNQFHYTRTFCHVFIQLSIYLKRLCYFINFLSKKSSRIDYWIKIKRFYLTILIEIKFIDSSSSITKFILGN